MKVAMVLMLAACGAGAAPQGALVGNWLGTLAVPGGQLRIVFRVSEINGGLTAVMDSIDQGAYGIPVQQVTFDGTRVRFVVPAVQGVYEGTLNEAGTQIIGTWTQGGAALPLTLDRVAEVPGLHRPQDPQPPFPYNAEDVTYRSPAGDITLAGTFTSPREGGPFPAVLLITGSGAQDRNQTIFGHRPFLVLADYLTRRGIAVLRVDDRGVGGSGGSLQTATYGDLVTDVLAGVAWLKANPNVRQNAIGLVGHSEGGIIAPMAAAQSTDIAYLSLLAAPAIPGDELLLLQGELIGRASGLSDEALARNRALQVQLFAILHQETEHAVIERRARAVLQAYVDALPEEEREALGDPQAFINAQVAAITTPTIRLLVLANPAVTLAQVRQPVQALYGARDLQVPPRQNAPAMMRALMEGNNPDVEVRVFPQLNHLFQTSTTGLPSEYATIEETFAPVAMQAVAAWVLGHGGR